MFDANKFDFPSVTRERLKNYLLAEEAVLKNQEYTIGGRTYRRADLSDIRKAIDDLLDEIALEESLKTGSRSRRVTFID